MQAQSFLHKVKDLRIVSGTFKNDAGQDQPYKSIQLIVSSDGQDEVLPLSGQSATKPSSLSLALKGADDVAPKANNVNNEGFLED